MKYILLILTNLWIVSTPAQSLSGAWKGELDIQGMKLPLVFHLTQTSSSLSATMDSPAQGAKGIKVDSAEWVNGQLSLVVSGIRLKYVGRLAGADSIAGTFTQMNTSIPLGLMRSKDSVFHYKRPQTPQPPFDYKTEEVLIKNEQQGNTLAGTLTTPYIKTSFPVVVMITGSGAQDRDETIFGHKPFWVIADYFANNGIGTLRLDDRGVGGSSAGKSNPTSADFATDIDAAVNFLADKGFKDIGLVGHSEGGLIAPWVANQNNKVRFLISMAGPGVPIDTMMIKQLEAALKLGNVPDATASANKAIVREAYQFNNQYKGDNFKADLENHLMKKFPLAQDMNKAVASQVGTPWFSYFAKQNPQESIQKLKIPILALNGTLDFQVDAALNLTGWKTSLKKAGNRHFETVELPGLNHLFQEAQTGYITEYATIEQTISPKVLQLMTNWILKLKKN